MSTRTPNKRFRFSLADLPLLLVWLVVFYFTWLFMHGADHFLAMTREALGKYFQMRYALIAHITAGGGSLLLGLLQFWPKLRLYSARTHRAIGLLYLLAVLVSSLTAVALAFTTAYTINWAYAFSLQVWVSVWISSTLIAYMAALKKKFKSHQEWMVRSYLVTLAFLISGLAVKLPVVQQLGSFEDISPSLFWMGWSVPLYIYQLFLNWRAKK
ncbi:hypothetical protein C7T94_14015 [Pedobacter yulinensis]|uniref:DUF2306 domain-containing protein n=1 Tax=Pedobacter yulinensis TaxID=2126353 RepID=A0A2T3HMI5_9SPHI|nr:DUF2306 domain-containing protein [Pedobacter yulinensis]PST83647.1 hypothetical protein C7T94_14015 [Pedobacter yulinensis]